MAGRGPGIAALAPVPCKSRGALPALVVTSPTLAVCPATLGRTRPGAGARAVPALQAHSVSTSTRPSAQRVHPGVSVHLVLRSATLANVPPGRTTSGAPPALDVLLVPPTKVGPPSVSPAPLVPSLTGPTTDAVRAKQAGTPRPQGPPRAQTARLIPLRGSRVPPNAALAPPALTPPAAVRSAAGSPGQGGTQLGSLSWWWAQSSCSAVAGAVYGAGGVCASAAARAAGPKMVRLGPHGPHRLHR